MRAETARLLATDSPAAQGNQSTLGEVLIIILLSYAHYHTSGDDLEVIEIK